MIESHYWLFGEEYHLVAAAERKFEEALRRYTYILRGQNKKVQIDHKDKNREMDIFAVRQLMNGDKINNIVVELKNPKVNLGREELNQVTKYMEVITEQDEFNAPNMTWQFYLVGNGFDSSQAIEKAIASHKPHGETSLVYNPDQGKTRIYVKTWSEIFTEFELRHYFLLEKLKLQRNNFLPDGRDADDIVKDQVNSTASRLPEPEMPPKPKQ